MTLRNRTPLFALIAVVGSALALPAMAQDAQEQAATQAQQEQAAGQAEGAAVANGGGQTWASVDTDGDGSISKAESQANAGLAQVFDAADGNKDGKLTQEEYRTFAAKQQK
jgi:hypothetical protein